MGVQHRSVWLGLYMTRLTVGTEQGAISELIRSEAVSDDVISGIGDNNIPAVFNHQCHMVRERANTLSRLTGAVWRCISAVGIVKVNRPSGFVNISPYMITFNE